MSLIKVGGEEIGDKICYYDYYVGEVPREGYGENYLIN